MGVNAWQARRLGGEGAALPPAAGSSPQQSTGTTEDPAWHDEEDVWEEVPDRLPLHVDVPESRHLLVYDGLDLLRLLQTPKTGVVYIEFAEGVTTVQLPHGPIESPNAAVVDCSSGLLDARYARVQKPLPGQFFWYNCTMFLDRHPWDGLEPMQYAYLQTYEDTELVVPCNDTQPGSGPAIKPQYFENEYVKTNDKRVLHHMVRTSLRCTAQGNMDTIMREQLRRGGRPFTSPPTNGTWRLLPDEDRTAGQESTSAGGQRAGEGGSPRRGMWVGVVVGAIATIAVMVGGVLCWRWRRGPAVEGVHAATFVIPPPPSPGAYKAASRGADIEFVQSQAASHRSSEVATVDSPTAFETPTLGRPPRRAAPVQASKPAAPRIPDCLNSKGLTITVPGARVTSSARPGDPTSRALAPHASPSPHPVTMPSLRLPDHSE